jgi:ABC-type xylose transport system permease subunit
MKPQPEYAPGWRRVRVVVSLVLGLLIGAFFHYVLYRFSLPSKPFIYVTF